MTGDYQHRPGREAWPANHVRKVQWLNTEVPGSSVPADVLQPLSSLGTVCQIQRTDGRAGWKPWFG